MADNGYPAIVTVGGGGGVSPTVPAHHTSHEPGGSDEILGLTTENMLPAFASDLVEPIFTQWRPIHERRGLIPAGSGIGTYVLGTNADSNMAPVGGSGCRTNRSFPLNDPNLDFPAAGRHQQFRLRGVLFTGATGGSNTVQISLRQITSRNDVGDFPIITGLGGGVGGEVPASWAFVHDRTGFEQIFSSAGWNDADYVLALRVTSAIGANTWADIVVQLEIGQPA